MMLFNSYFFLSFIFIVLYSCRPTVAATLAVSPVKRGRLFVHQIQCRGSLPHAIPPDFPRFPNLQAMCARPENHPRNLECDCEADELLCGSSTRPDVQILISRCFAYCECATETKVIRDRFTTELKFGARQSGTGTWNTVDPPISPFATGHMQTYDPSAASNGGVSTHSCSKKCSNINRDCDRFFTGDCKCFAPPVASLYWHTASCGLVHELRKRNLAQQRRSYYLNVTVQYTRLNKAAAPPGPPPPDLAAQLVSGLLPSPCNASYVSFACSDSKDGIVHEPPQNWLGALLPENAKELPPVPEEFLRIHHEREAKMQVLRPAGD